jgi:ABC-type branched-subunit amino acid transport system ATPase component
MARLNLDQVSKSFGTAEILKSVSLSIADGEFVVLVGPSGCGKSTLLRLIAGLDPVTSGTLQIGDRVVNNLAPAERKIAMVFQSYALYPHKNVRDNMTFGLKFSGMKKDEIDRRVAEATRMLQLSELLERKPRDLSGGQRQRVAIGRAIVREPDVFLFDEPLSNLDAALRVSTRVEIARLHAMLRATMIYVTHDQTEAMTLADRIVVMNKGRIEQVGAPLDLYFTPANLFVAGFIGSPSMNLFPAHLTQAGEVLNATADFGYALPVKGGTLASGASVTIGIRPEHILFGDTPYQAFTARVELVERLGEISYLHCAGTNGTPLIAEWRGRQTPSVGDTVKLSADPTMIHLFNADGTRIPEALS